MGYSKSLTLNEQTELLGININYEQRGRGSVSRIINYSVLSRLSQRRKKFRHDYD